MLRKLLLLTTLATAELAVGGSGTGTYSVTDIGALVGSSGTTAYGINNAGQVVGSSFAGLVDCTCWLNGMGLSYAFLWSKGTMTNLGLPPAVCALTSVAYGINDHGQVVGTTSYPQGWCPAYSFVYTGGAMQTINGGLTGFAGAVNDNGQVVGNFAAGIYNISTSTISPLGTLAGSYTAGYGINNAGQVVGLSYLADNQTYHAFLWNGTVMKDLGTLGGTNSQAKGINGTGQIVGVSDVGGGVSHAFLYSGGLMSNLGGTLGGTNSQADSINSSGQIVGWANTAGGAQHAFLFSSGTMVDLNTLVSLASGGYLLEATGINDIGQIVANGSDGHAYLLTPASSGTISVTTNLPAAAFTITGPATYSGNGISFTQPNVPTGTYTVSFSAVSGYLTPASVTASLTAGSTLNIEVEYIAILGTLNVITNLTGAIFTVDRPASFSGRIAPLASYTLPIGHYSIAFSPIPGYNTPPSTSGDLLANTTLTLEGNYALIPGSGILSVSTNIASATYTITGPASLNGTGSTKAIVPAGTYTVTFRDIPASGLITPPSQTTVLLSGQTATITGKYYSTALPATVTNPPCPVYTGINLYKNTPCMAIMSRGLRVPGSVSGVVNVSNNTGAWYKITIHTDGLQSVPVTDQQLPVTFLLAPYGAYTSPDVAAQWIQFQVGRQLRVDVSKNDPDAMIAFLFDFMARLFLGSNLPTASTAGYVRLTVGAIPSMLSTIRTGCFGPAAAASYVSATALDDPAKLTDALQKLAAFAGCTVEDPTVRAATTQLVAALFGADKVDNFVKFGEQASKVGWIL